MNKWIYIFISILFLIMLLSVVGYDHWERQETVQMPWALESASAQPVVCTDAATREKIKTIMLDALDHALQTHIERMFEVWMRDDRGQPERAKNGTIAGVNAYVSAGRAVAAWAPPDCPG